MGGGHWAHAGIEAVQASSYLAEGERARVVQFDRSHRFGGVCVRRSWWTLRLRFERAKNGSKVWRVGVFVGDQRSWQWRTAIERHDELTLDQACDVAGRMASKYSGML